MNRSESITKLAISLVKFNAEVSAISKDGKNPYFKSEYVTLDKLIENTREILQKNGLSVMQFPLSKESGEIGIQTILLHESGEYIESDPLYMKPAKNDPQQAGSIISYLRRYSYQAILNLNTGEDDDANRCSKVGQKKNSLAGISEQQVKMLYELGKGANQSPATIFSVAKKSYGIDKIEDLNPSQFNEIVNRLKKAQK